MITDQLEKLKKDFTKIAVRYGSKVFLDATSNVYAVNGYSSIFNTHCSDKKISYSYISHLTNYINPHVKDYEIKQFLMNMKLFIKENNLTYLNMTFVHGELSVEGKKEVEVDFSEGLIV